MNSDINLVEISWEGPYDINQINDLNDSTHYGIYAVYGTHTIFGMNTLLYIGKAEDRTFGARLPEHQEEWGLVWHHTDLKFYIGRIGSTLPITDDNLWSLMIERAERLMIHYCKPPYNAKDLKNLGEDIKNFTVFNFGKKLNLPAIVSSQWIESSWWGEGWKEFTNTTLIRN
jgi:hypothetical protein